MTEHSRLSRFAAVVVAAAVVLSPATPVLASSFQLIEQNASGLGNAYAGQAAGVKDASAVFFNPAALTRLDGKQVALSVNGIGISMEFADSGSGRPYLPTTPPTTFPVAAGSAGGNAGGWIPIPNAYLSWQAAQKLWVGLGFNSPFGLKTEWDSDWMGRFHGIKSDLKTINLNPTLAYKVTDSFSLGAGASYQRLSATLTQAVPYGGLALAGGTRAGLPAAAVLGMIGGPAGLATEGSVDITGDSWAWGWNAGAQLKLGERGRFGVTYRSKVKHGIEGDVTFAGRPSFASAGPLSSSFADGKVTTDIELPETVSVAAAYESGKLELLADWTWTGWSSIQDLTILRDDAHKTQVSSVPLRFEDTWRAGVGASYLLNDKWTLRVGTAYDRSPVQDEFRTPRLPDANRIWAAGGVKWQTSKNGAVDFGLAHIFIKDASSNLPNQDTPTSAPKGKLVGTYTSSVNIVSLQYRYSF